jgi:BCD family chlorophyll transporter-like MFS transporter
MDLARRAAEAAQGQYSTPRSTARTLYKERRVNKLLATTGVVIRTVQLTLPRAAIGWMFALLTSNFNRIAVFELGIAAIWVTSMIGLYHFLSPFQVVFGRIADQRPIFGLRRSPYLFAGLFLSSLIFVALPGVAIGMSEGSLLAFLAGFGLFVIFGIGFAMAGSSHLALVADVTTERNRNITISLVWTVLIVSTIISLSFIRSIMPVYDPATMQRLYTMTVPVVAILTLLGILGVEKRLPAGELEKRVAEAKLAASDGSFVQTIRKLLGADATSKYFFIFVFVSTIGIFLQDTILEVFGADVMGMTLNETGSFQQLWGAGVLLGMFLIGLVTLVVKLPMKQVAMAGTLGAAVGMLLIVYVSLTSDRGLMTPALLFLGFFTGLYTVGTLATMMKLSTAAARATYIGLWGFSLAMANGFSSIVAGGLVTLLIESGWLVASVGYAVIFLCEAGLLVVAALTLRGVNVDEFAGMTHGDIATAMEVEVTA